MTAESQQPSPGPGRPTKLTPELQERVAAHVAAGAYVETAVAACGISKTSFYEWLRRGAEENEGPHREFLDAVEKAQAEAELKDLENITRAAAEGNWQASAWRLERKFPDRWARRERMRLEHTGKDDGPIAVQVNPVQVVISLPSNGREAKNTEPKNEPQGEPK